MRRKQSRPGRRVQLHRALAKLGWGSRTQAWDWIRAGEVCVDGRVVTDPLSWVDLDQQQITRGGKSLQASALVTLALHKPRGVVTTRCDERGRRTVYDLLPADLPWIFPAGRLDADSEGLLILTNDAQLALRLTEPAHHIPKTYHVSVTPIPTEETLEQLRRGISLLDGRTRPAQFQVLGMDPHSAQVEVIVTEGRNRQIRRMWAAVGHRVRRLIRVGIGGYRLGDLASGALRSLDAAAIQQLLQKS